MIVSKFLTYDEDDSQTWVDLYFKPNDVQGVFISKDGYLCIILSGQIYELEYSKNLFDTIKQNLSIKTLGFN